MPNHLNRTPLVEKSPRLQSLMSREDHILSVKDIPLDSEFPDPTLFQELFLLADHRILPPFTWVGGRPWEWSGLVYYKVAAAMYDRTTPDIPSLFLVLKPLFYQDSLLPNKRTLLQTTFPLKFMNLLQYVKDGKFFDKDVLKESYYG